SVTGPAAGPYQGQSRPYQQPGSMPNPYQQAPGPYQQPGSIPGPYQGQSGPYQQPGSMPNPYQGQSGPCQQPGHPPQSLTCQTACRVLSAVKGAPGRTVRPGAPFVSCQPVQQGEQVFQLKGFFERAPNHALLDDARTHRTYKPGGRNHYHNII